MQKCDTCNEKRTVTIKLELFNSEIEPYHGEELTSGRICLICLEKREWKIDIRELIQLDYEDLVDLPEDYFEDD